jgi:hypothetical protein
LCSFARANIVFLISSSSSICNSQNSCSQWALELNFVTNIINAFNIGSNNVLVGVVTYSAIVNSAFYMNTFSDKSNLINFVNNLQYAPGGNGPIDFAGGLREARTSQFTTGRGLRLGAQSVLIVLTNGESSVTSASAVAELNLIRAAGIEVIPIGLSSTATAQVVSSLVVPPPPYLNWNYFLNAAINQNLQSLASPVSSQVCLAVSSNCLSQVMDIVFVVPGTMSVWQASGNNGNYWSNMMNFIGDLVQQMNIVNVRVGLVAFGDFAVTLIPLNNNQPDANSMANLIRSQGFQNLSFGHNIQSAINVMRTQTFSVNSGARSGVPQVAVLITDAASSANTLSTLSEANAAFQQGIRIFTIGVTNNVNLTELQLLSSQPRLLNHQWWTISSLDYSSQLQPLEYIVETELCRPYYDVNCRYTTYGGYQCFCQWGACDVRPMNGTTCVDVNECSTNNGGCAQQCSNSAGSFSCSCGTGFQLAQDQRTCVDINECNSGSGSAGPCIGNALCINTYGNYYCLSNNALVSSLHGEAPASFNEPLMAAFPGTVIGLSAALAVTVTILIAVVVGFMRYAIRRGRRESDDESDLIADVSDCEPTESAPGLGLMS